MLKYGGKIACTIEGISVVWVVDSIHHDVVTITVSNYHQGISLRVHATQEVLCN